MREHLSGVAEVSGRVVTTVRKRLTTEALSTRSDARLEFAFTKLFFSWCGGGNKNSCTSTLTSCIRVIDVVPHLIQHRKSVNTLRLSFSLFLLLSPSLCLSPCLPLLVFHSHERVDASVSRPDCERITGGSGLYRMTICSKFI